MKLQNGSRMDEKREKLMWDCYNNQEKEDEVLRLLKEAIPDRQLSEKGKIALADRIVNERDSVGEIFKAPVFIDMMIAKSVQGEKLQLNLVRIK